MGAMFRLDLSGDVALKQILTSLEPKLAKEALKTALKESAKVILRGAKFRAPQDSGVLAKSLKVKAFKRTRKKVIGFTVGTAAGDYKGKEFYGAFQEFGWVPSNKPASNAVSGAQKTLRADANFRKKGRAAPLALRAKITAAKLTLARYAGKKVPGKNFIQQSFKDNAQQVKNDLVSEIYKAINKIMDKKGK